MESKSSRTSPAASTATKIWAKRLVLVSLSIAALVAGAIVLRKRATSPYEAATQIAAPATGIATQSPSADHYQANGSTGEQTAGGATNQPRTVSRAPKVVTPQAHAGRRAQRTAEINKRLSEL